LNFPIRSPCFILACWPAEIFSIVSNFPMKNHVRSGESAERVLRSSTRPWVWSFSY
jgi:hypothetical protein